MLEENQALNSEPLGPSSEREDLRRAAECACGLVVEYVEAKVIGGSVQGERVWAKTVHVFRIRGSEERVFVWTVGKKSRGVPVAVIEGPRAKGPLAAFLIWLRNESRALRWTSHFIRVAGREEARRP